MTAPRTLSVILAADAVGYSRLSEKDEPAALSAVSWFRERAAAIVAAHKGRVFSRAGDGVMAEFATVQAGVGAALELEGAVRAHMAGASGAALPVRIGVHLGDVAVEGDGDRLGHEVNVAARLQQLAEPGEVLVSRGVADAARGFSGARFERLGRERVKNLSEPIEVFRVLPRVGGATRIPKPLIAAAAAAAIAAALLTGIGLTLTQRGATAPSSAAELSVAVLPFADMSPEGDQEYFADGLSEELMNQLAQIEGLLVTGRTSAFVYKDHTEDLRTIGETLGVAHILEGSVRKSGDQLRITAQLINAADGYHLWSRTYDRDLGDIFAIQEDIAVEVAHALSAQLGVAATEDPFAPQSDDLVAYDLFLRAERFRISGSREELLRAEQLYREVVARDPDFLAAWAGLASTLTNITFFFVDRIDEAAAERDAIVDRLIADEPEGWGGYLVRGLGATGRGDLLQARRALDRARELAPPARRAIIDEALIYLRGRTGQYAATLEPTLAAVRVDPLSMDASLNLQLTLYALGRVDDAEAEYRRSLDLPGSRTLVEAVAALRAAHEGYGREVVQERYDRLLATLPTTLQEGAFDIMAVFDDREAALAGLRRELERERDPTAMNPVSIAMWADYYNDADLTIEALRRRLDLQGVGGWGPFEPTLQNVRRDPRFKDLVRDYGYLDYWRGTGEWADDCHPVGDDDFECS